MIKQKIKKYVLKCEILLYLKSQKLT